MNAYAVTVGMYTRIYFMIFYLVTMIVLTIVVSSFLEAFRFRIQYKKSTSKHDGKYSSNKRFFFFSFFLVKILFLCNIYSCILFFRRKNAP